MNFKTKLKLFFSIMVIGFISIPPSFSATETIDLIVDYKYVDFTGKKVEALAVNGQVPAPTLRFKEGDTVILNVHNRLKESTSMHWHGIILPWQMDGVAGVSQEPIPPGGVFQYKFKLNQAGTYWYHSHAGLQEQQGIYGAFIIDPAEPSIEVTKDFSIVLSDWSNTHPEEIYANLKKKGDYYSSLFPMQTSLVDFIRSYHKGSADERKALMATYKMMQHMRMSPYDISDVAYDIFLLNGQTHHKPWKAKVKVGDIVRLRIIDAAANTQFKIKIPESQLDVIHVQGQDVVPYAIPDLLIAPGETYDLLVKITEEKPTLIYVESADKLGYAVGALVTNENQEINIHDVEPFPNPKPMIHGAHGATVHSNMMNDNHSATEKMTKETHAGHAEHSMDHSGLSHASQNEKPYQQIKATKKTNNPSKAFHPITLKLGGYMGRYLWFINDVPEYKAKPLEFTAGERYRMTFINDTMMFHPMHIHGHWFILRNGYGEYDPLLHTINVPPGETITVDVESDASGQWIFHCHNLYHMRAGMGIMLRYTDSQDTTASHPELSASDAKLLMHGEHHPSKWYSASHLDLSRLIDKNAYELSLKTQVGGDYHKFEWAIEAAELAHGKVEKADVDMFYWHLLSEFWAVKGGINYVYCPSSSPYFQAGIGIEGLMPYFIDTDIRAYLHKGSFKMDIDLSRDNQITRRFFIRTGIRSILATQTIETDKIGTGINEIEYSVRPYYQLHPKLAIFTEYNHTHFHGVQKNLRSFEGKAARETNWKVGFSALF